MSLPCFPLRSRSVWPRLGLFLLGCCCLFACSPLTTPIPTDTPTDIPTLTATVTLTPTPAPTLTPSPIPTPACFSRPGQVLDGAINTDLLPKPMTYHVYLPPCYAEQPQRRYPVLYLLHGQTYNEDQWIRLGVPATADRLIAAGQLPPFIIVFPYDYSYLQPWQYHFEDVFMQLLIPQIDTTYRSVPQAAQRAVGGLSRGGAWALHLGIIHPDVFGAIGAHSPAIFYSDGNLRKLITQIPPDKLPRIYIDLGDADSEMSVSLDFKQFLDENEIPYEWHEYVGFHNEDYWAAHVEEYLRWYAQPWQSAP